MPEQKSGSAGYHSCERHLAWFFGTNLYSNG